MLENIKKRLKNMLKWSDRLGSDEVAEIEDIIAYIETMQKT